MVITNFHGDTLLTRSGFTIIKVHLNHQKASCLSIKLQDVTTAIILYYLFEIEVEFHGWVYLVSEDIGVVWNQDSSRSLFELLSVQMTET